MLPLRESLLGLQEIINNPTILNLINSITVDDTARQRISHIDYGNYEDFFTIKHSWYTLQPAKELSTHIPQCDDQLTKWFLLLYSIASVNSIYKTHIYQFLDQRLYEYWPDPNNERPLILYRLAEGFDHSLDGIIDLDRFVKPQLGFADNNRRWQDCRQGIILFCLSAGYHWSQRGKYISHEMYERRAGMPMIISLAHYVSILTGAEFYESLNTLLESFGAKGALDDVIAQVKAEAKRQALLEDKKQLLEQLSLKEEAIRKQETALDIICESYGLRVSKDKFYERISRCNKESSREVLYKAESIIGQRLSYVDKIALIGQKDLLISSLSSEYNIILSPREVNATSNIEDLVNIINDHRYFIAAFDASIYGEPLKNDIGNELYDLETKVKEVNQKYGLNINVSTIGNVEDLRCSVINQHPGLNEIKDAIINILSVDPCELTDNASFQNDLGADSLDLVEIIMEVEKKLDITLGDDEYINTLGEARELIARKLREKAEKINQ